MTQENKSLNHVFDTKLKDIIDQFLRNHLYRLHKEAMSTSEEDVQSIERYRLQETMSDIFRAMTMLEILTKYSYASCLSDGSKDTREIISDITGLLTALNEVLQRQIILLQSKALTENEAVITSKAEQVLAANMRSVHEILRTVSDSERRKVIKIVP